MEGKITIQMSCLYLKCQVLTLESGISTTFNIWSFIKNEENEEASLYSMIDKVIKVELKIFEATKNIELEGRISWFLISI